MEYWYVFNEKTLCDKKITLKFTRKKIIRLLNVFAIVSFSGSLASNSEGNIKCVPLNNWPCQARPILADINSNETHFYPFTVSVNK